jgi:hypothetical protein
VPFASQGVQAWDRFAYANNSPSRFNDPSGHIPCDEIAPNGQCISYDRLKLPKNDTPAVPDSPENGDSATPWDVGEEWLTGKGRRSHEFRDRDPFTELLQRHKYLEYLRKIIAERLKNGNFSELTAYYDLSGIEGVPKYISDYSTLLTIGKMGNLAVTYLGGFKVEIYIADVNFSTGQASVLFNVYNSSTLGSGIRPPVLGYTKFWNNTVAPMLNPSQGPMSEVTQSFWWYETINF